MTVKELFEVIKNVKLGDEEVYRFERLLLIVNNGNSVENIEMYNAEDVKYQPYINLKVLTVSYIDTHYTNNIGQLSIEVVVSSE